MSSGASASSSATSSCSTSFRTARQRRMWKVSSGVCCNPGPVRPTSLSAAKGSPACRKPNAEARHAFPPLDPTGADMTTVSLTESRGAARAGGWSLIAAAIGFMAVFSYLAARFSYPDVLDGPAAEVLPRLVALGSSGRTVWAIYAFLPLLLIPAGIGAYAALRDAAPNAMRAALVFSVVSAVSMLLGLARWPSVHWELT